jgi:hydroxypyruvate isomerase
VPRLAANLTMLFTSEPVLERASRVRAAGFHGIEILFPYEWPASDLKAWVREAGVELVLINVPPGDWNSGERGLAAQPGREADFRSTFGSALEYATQLACPRIHVMAGLRSDEPDACDRSFVDNLRHAADEANRFDIDVLIEPLNDRDVPGYHLSRLHHAKQIIATVGRDNVGLQFDFYHTRIMEGDVEAAYGEYKPLIRHTQIAGLPGRHEPDGGEVDGPAVLRLLDADAYPGWVGCEYRPRTAFEAGLGWLADFGIAAPSSRATT